MPRAGAGGFAPKGPDATGSPADLWKGSLMNTSFRISAGWAL